MEYRYWTLLTDTKFSILYLGMHRRWHIKCDRWLDIAVALISSASVIAWAESILQPNICTFIILIGQVIQIAKPIIPFRARIKDLNEYVNELSNYYYFMESKWFEIYNNNLNDTEINELIYKCQTDLLKMDSKFLKDDSLNNNAKFERLADEQTNSYFDNNFS